MNLWQAKRQLAWLLKQSTWEDAPNDTVLTDAFVSEDLEGNFLPGDFLADGPVDKTLPFARVTRAPADQVKHTAFQDPESLGRMGEVSLRAYVVQGGSGVAGSPGDTATDAYDTHGENQVTGALRDPVDGAGSSTGRDVDEIVDRLVDDVLGEGQLVDSIHALQGEVFADLEAEPVDGVQQLSRPIDFVIYNATRKRYYHPGHRLTGEVVGDIHQFEFLSIIVEPAGTVLTITIEGVAYNFVAGTDWVRTGAVATECAAIASAINAHPVVSTLVTATPSPTVNPVGVVITRDAGTDYISLASSWNGIVATNSIGNFDLTWELPPMRFDTLRGMLRRGDNPGDPPPSAPDEGTEVPLAGDLDTSVTALMPDIGAWGFSYFMGYAETTLARTADTPDRYSDPVSVVLHN